MPASWLVLAVGAALSSAPVAPAKTGVPPPRAGAGAPTVLALLHHSHELCNHVGEGLLTHWRGLRAGGAHEQDALDNYVLKRTSEISQARATGDFVRRFLPQARQETDDDTAAVLERLYDLETSLCNAVASPRPPRQDFAAGVQEILEQIESKEAELGRLLVVSDDALQKALEPYLEPVRKAGVEAEKEYQAYLESIRPKERPPTRKELMTAWHQRYQQGVQPTKLALTQYLRARKQHDARALGATCRELLMAVLPLLDNPFLFKAPDSRVEVPLREAYREIRQWAGYCASGRFDQVDKHYERMQQYLARASALLAEYDLRP